jgi:dihydrofolate reductase
VAKIRVHNLSMSLDGYVAGPDQGVDAPIGVGGLRLHEWMFATSTFRERHGADGGEGGIDDDYVGAGDLGVRATIMGRNMFGPVRGSWDGTTWAGWWGSNPPFHHAVFVLTHHARPPLEMEGGTTFFFVTDGIEAALERGLEAAGGADVRIGGGAATVRAYLRAGLIDEMHLALVPIRLGGGQRLFEGEFESPANYTCTGLVTSSAVVHASLVRQR